MQVFLFDIDGTLIHTGGAGRAALEAALGEAFGITEPIKDVRVIGRTDRGIASELFRHHSVDERNQS